MRPTVERRERYDELAPEGLPALPGARADRVGWGPVWAGIVVALATFLLLQLALFATDAINLDINPTDSSNAIPIWTGLAAVAAFFVGGLTTGASSKWDRVTDGLLQGVVLWSTAVVALVVLSIIGAGAVSSGLSGVFDRIDVVDEAISDVNAGVDTDAALDDAQDAAASATLLLGATIVATAIGAMVGAKLWPRRRRHVVTTDTMRTSSMRPGDDLVGRSAETDQVRVERTEPSPTTTGGRLPPPNA